MSTTVEQTFRELIADKRKFIENLLVVENKDRQLVPFIYNPIQADINATQTGMDIWVKPSQVGFSTERIANRLVDTLTAPGTNTVLIAYEDFVTERLLSKVSFFYNHLAGLNIPGFPEIFHNSSYEKTFKFYQSGRVISTSSIYIASARSYVAGRTQTIHHLLCDEFAFYIPGAIDRIIAPALARIPPGGTADIYSTPNGEENDFHDMYALAREGKSVFTPHFYAWFVHPEYYIPLGDIRIEAHIPETNRPEFDLSVDEVNLVNGHGLSFDQIRWRRWMVKTMESLRRSGETRTLFGQEFPEDDVSCFLSSGDMYFDTPTMDRIANDCHPALEVREGLHIWYKPEKGKKYIVAIDPGQAKVSLSAITVLCFDQDEYGNYKPRYCARDAGLYSPEITVRKAVAASDLYNRAEIAWEANSHGLAITELLKNRRPIYMRKDIISGRQTMEPGWLTTPKTKDYMLQTANKYLYDLICHDIELARQCRNHRLIGDKVEVVGANDIFMSFAVGLMCLNPKPMKRGYLGRAGWKW